MADRKRNMKSESSVVNELMEIRNLRTYFYTVDGVIKAVDDISYDVARGEIVGLVGESGCGKSVTALSIMGLISDPPGRIIGGEVLFEGRDLLKLDKEAIRQVRGREIAMVFQEPMTSLNPVLTVERQLTEALEEHMGMTRSAAIKRAGDLLVRVGIPNPERQLRQYPHQFSGGMRQRLMIAIAISCNPKLIIADEATTAVDVTIQAQILELLKSLTKEAGMGLILITHNLGVVARYADRANVMYAGRIIECGGVRDIYRHTAHPYTMGLLRSVPRLDVPKKERLDPIEGQTPDLADLPLGCAFYKRCRYAIEICASEYPPLASLGDGHQSTCWLSEKLER